MPCDHENYHKAKASLQAIADLFSIDTDLDGIIVTPLHWLFHVYLSGEAADGEELIKFKFKQLDVEEVHLKALMRLDKEGWDAGDVMSDCFLDAGNILLWCLAYSKNDLLRHLLSYKMIDFWRFAHVKTLLWSCLLHSQRLESRTSALQSLLVIITSPVMKSMFNSMSMI